MLRPKEFIPGQQAPQDYVFNVATGWPNEINTQINQFMNKYRNQPLSYSQHAQERENQKGLNIGQITKGKFPQPENGWSPVEVSHNGKDITKMVLRGPYSETHDAVIPVIPTRNGVMAKTIWPNEKNDTHKTLDLNRVHLPEEFKGGKAPRRSLMQDWQVRQPGYRPIPANSMSSRQRIVDRFGYNQKPQQPQGMNSAVANFLDYNMLRKRLNSARPIFFAEPS